jgi:hypothetical protein
MKYVNATILLIACISIGNTLPAHCQVANTQSAGDTQGTDSTPELRGLLPAQPNAAPAASSNVPDVTGSVTISVERDYIPIDHMRGLVVKVANQSQHPVLVNCDDAKALVSPRDVASLRDVEKVESPPTGFVAVLLADTKDTLIAGLTVGAAPAINDIRIHQGPILKRYGEDETRRENEMQRFGKRLMWPGETSSGTIFFKTDESLVGSKLEVPLTLPFVSNSTTQTPQIISSLVVN